ncbi:MAG: hypothetical protein J6T34_05625, partial [Bacilli bacterium]|nr:hypothetical protein [Bacilli bacterium]
AVLWRYDNGDWVQLNSPQSEQIYFGSYNSFPTIGSPNVIYVDGTNMYRWLNGSYIGMGGGSIEWIAF